MGRPRAPGSVATPIALPREPARGLAVVSCMDCRIDPLQAFGLALGDAVVLRNAGAQVSDDVLRSLGMAHAGLGVLRRARRRAHRLPGAPRRRRGGDGGGSARHGSGSARRCPTWRSWGGLLDVRTGAVAPVVTGMIGWMCDTDAV